MTTPPHTVAKEPLSPRFARGAAQLLKEGKTAEAAAMCENGVKAYPRYATGHLVLGRCYETLGRSVEAMLSYRRVLNAVPDNAVAQHLVQEAERREQEAFRSFAEERERKLRQRRNTLSFEKYTAEESAGRESTVEFLLKRLQEAKRITPQPSADRNVVEESTPAKTGASKIVTATLAEIYANQGEYKEAIEAYNKLLEQRPLEAERYQQRIAELENLLRHQEEGRT